jgi:hypothetical protein
MTGSSGLLTIGTVLDRAMENGTPVSLTYNGSAYGVSGVIVGRDEQGVALVVDIDYIVVRLSDITSVRALARSIDAPVPAPRDAFAGVSR